MLTEYQDADPEGTTTQGTCSPYLACIPLGLLDIILDFALELHRPDGAIDSCEFRPKYIRKALFAVCTKLRKAAISCVQRKEFIIRAISWPLSTGNTPRQGLPVAMLQHMDVVRFDFSNLEYEELTTVHPCVQQLAGVWNKKHVLGSVSIFVTPHLWSLFEDPPRLTPDPAVEDVLFPLLQMFDTTPGNVKVTWEPYDFDGPSLLRQDSALTFIARPPRSEKLLRFVISMSNGNANRKYGPLGHNALHYAAGSHSIEKAKVLLDAGLEVNAKDNLGNTALMFAVHEGDEEMARLLLIGGKASKSPVSLIVDARDTSGNTALMHATSHGNDGLVKLLLVEGEGEADRGLRNDGGKTPLQIAEGKGHDSIVQLLQDQLSR